MPKQPLQQRLEQQHFDNGYELVDGVAMHAENGDRFQIPHDVLKKHVNVGHFVEVRIDSPRFSVHKDAPIKCMCPVCNGEATKPILSHDHPATFVELPKRDVPSRGWGEDFWVQVTQRNGDYFAARVDNPLYETRLHGVNEGDVILFHADHILAVHPSHREEIVLGMDAVDLKELATWLASQRQ
ncbi:MAG: hypothetical protein H8E66_24880 [Planctomycetes bacterium]|nr:hypothetical protein [Planctomycetota bacterium]